MKMKGDRKRRVSDGVNKVTALSGSLLLLLSLLLYLNIRGLSTWISVMNEMQIELSPASTSQLKPFALMTEARCLNATPFVLQNAIEMLPENIKVVLLHANENKGCISEFIQENPILNHANSSGRFIHTVDSHIRGEKNYKVPHHYSSHWLSIMYTNATFWKGMKLYGNLVLTIQADTLICSLGFPNWNLNYIGGISYGRPTDKWAVNDTNTLHLNGGLSIRNLDWMISCLEDYNFTNSRLAEDAVFNTCDLGNIKIGEAMAFASDSGHTMCFNDWKGDRICPWGVHKPWVLGVGRGPPIRELVRYCPDIQNHANVLGRNENVTGEYCIGKRCI
jgi:hypothetical protein